MDKFKRDMHRLTWLSRRQALAWAAFVIVAVGAIVGLSRCEGRQQGVPAGFQRIVFEDSAVHEPDSMKTAADSAAAHQVKGREKGGASKAPKKKNRPQQRDFLGEEIPGAPK